MIERHREILLPQADAQRELRRRSRRDFLIAGVAGVGAIGGYKWVTKARREKALPWPQRRVLEVNRRLAEGYVSDSHLMPTYSANRVEYLKMNGDIGIDTPIDVGSWQLQVATDAGPAVNLSLADIKVVRVPRSKIEAYRRLHNDRVSSDNEIARTLSEVPSTFGFRQSRWEGDVKYVDDLPPGLHTHEPTFEENGMGFWAIET
jgi:hypothetical protein